MAYYVIEYRYDSDLRNLVTDFRPAHRTFLRGLEKAGNLVSAGFFKDAGFDGAMLLLQADSAQEALDLLKDDPFSTNGLIEDVKARQWIPTVGQFAEDFDTSFPIS